ncbi:MFS transporter [Micromonospora profundi]|uniref:MFS transporter n=1 Tax=Micromonospora profundi TaxID=1420889 RepID=A0AAJ6HR82_9ACTN|nr:MFS transporter [Micromonospora profundi]WLS44712.1 MFS transporter [Micromonospora profundi]
MRQPRGRASDSSVLAVGHGVNDLYQGAVPALLPFLAAAHGWTYVMVGGLTLAATALSAITQPLFGWLTDRHHLAWLVPAGTTLAALGIALSGPATSYAATCAALAVCGLGVAAYHPAAARLARTAAAGSHRAMSWFVFSGTLGVAVAPLLVAPTVAMAGLSATLWLLAPALVMVVVTVRLLPATRRLSAPATTLPATVSSPPADDWAAFRRLTALVVLRSLVTYGLGTFVALLLNARTGTVVAGQAALLLLAATGALGTMAGGVLADRHRDRVRLIRNANVCVVPGLLMIVVLPGWSGLLGVAVTGVSLYVPFSLHLTLGQDYLPGRVGTASGVTLGLAVSAGGLAAPALGALAQATSLPVAIAALALSPLASLPVLRTMADPAVRATATRGGPF